MDYSFDAVIFDLDGVITRTATVHSAAWKEVFDSYLKEREKKYGEPFREFSVTEDYLPYVDGKPRYEGVKSFLESRGIDIPYGDPSDPPEKETCCGLGNRKNEAFNKILQRDGVEVFRSTKALIEELKQSGIKLGVASSSKNCLQVLKHAKLTGYFGTIVDGEVSARLGLKGKPEPDIFTEASKNLGVNRHRTVVVEDAVSGVMAGKKGNFGLVIGVARDDNLQELKKYGADLVVSDIGELGGIERIEKWFLNDLAEDSWKIFFTGTEKGKERARGLLTATGNGFMISQGTAGEMSFSPLTSPSTFMSASYKRPPGEAGNEGYTGGLVPAPDWMYLNFRVENSPFLNPGETEIINTERFLDMRNGLFTVKMTVKDNEGRITEIISTRAANMASRHQAAVRYTIKPLNYHGILTLRTRIDAGLIRNEAGDNGKNRMHLRKTECGHEGSISYLVAKTESPAIVVAEAAVNKLFLKGFPVAASWIHRERENSLDSEVQVEIPGNAELVLERFVSVHNSLITQEKDILPLAKKDVTKTSYFRQVVGQTSWVWEKLWSGTDIRIEGDRLAQKVFRLYIYHMMTATLHSNTGPGFGAPVWSGKGELSWCECAENDTYKAGRQLRGVKNATPKRAGDLKSFYRLSPEEAAKIMYDLAFSGPAEPESENNKLTFDEVAAHLVFGEKVSDAPGNKINIPFPGKDMAKIIFSEIAGITKEDGTTAINPLLPPLWEEISFNCCIDGCMLKISANSKMEIVIDSNNKNNDSFKFISGGRNYEVKPGEKKTVGRGRDTGLAKGKPGKSSR